MNPELIHQLITLGVVALVFVVFIRDWLSPDLAAMGAFVFLVIIGVIGAIAIPRMSQGARGAADAALKADIAALSNAIEMYAAEHNGTYPTLADFEDQLTTYTDSSGSTSGQRSLASSDLTGGKLPGSKRWGRLARLR